MLVILNAQLADRSPLKGIGRKWGSIQRESLRETAEYWHKQLFPSHFTPGNEQRYGLAARSQFYKTIIKPRAGSGQGRFVSLQLKGSSRRIMEQLATITATRSQAVVRMRPPSYFTNPFIGSFKDPKTGKTKRVTKQPDKPGEVVRLNDGDREKLTRFLEKTLQRKVAEARA